MPSRSGTTQHASLAVNHRRKRTSRIIAVAIATLVGPNIFSLMDATVPAVASITTDKSKAKALEATITAQASQVQTLVSQYDSVDGHLQVLDKSIANDKVQLQRDFTAEHQASHLLQKAAVDAYINAASGSASSIGTFISTSNASAIPTREAYLGFASGTLGTAIATYQQDQFTTTRLAQALLKEQRSTVATLSSLEASRQAVQLALNTEEATLKGVDSNLLTLVNQANEARARASAARAEAALAALAAQQASTSPVTVTVAPTVFGRYADPLRSIRGLSPERVDQGVDFGGYGPIYAIGDGVVLSVVNGGWPGGTFICYRLENGPANGLVVYTAEDINPEVQIGQQVTRNTVLGQLYGGQYGMEIGWAAPSADGVTMAATYGEYYGSNTTAFGANFSQFLSSLGAPGGQIQNSPNGSLPGGWPSW